MDSGQVSQGLSWGGTETGRTPLGKAFSYLSIQWKNLHLHRFPILVSHGTFVLLLMQTLGNQPVWVISQPRLYL